MRGADLVAMSGELTALLGPSGCGKTTLLRVIAGLERADSGRLFLDGKDLSPIAPKDRDVALVFQQPALYPYLTARENLAFGLKLRKVPAPDIRQRVGEAAELLEITDCLDRLPQELSGGQRQRVSLGRAIVRRPQVYLLDEPLSQLDAPMRLQLRRDLRRIQQELGVTMVFVTHDQADAFAIADRVAVMIDGAILQCDRPAGIHDQPACVPVAKFIGNPPMNLFPVLLLGAGDRPALQWEDAGGIPRLSLPKADLSGDLANYVGKEIILGIRPEHVSIVTDPLPGEPTATGRIASVEYSGADLVLHLLIEAVTLAARVPAGVSLTPGQQVKVALRLSKSQCYEPGSGTRIQGLDHSG